MIVTHNFKKRPSKKNLANRSLSFQNFEVDLVSKSDKVSIEVYFGAGATIRVEMKGDDFLKSIVDVGAKDYKVLNF